MKSKFARVLMLAGLSAGTTLYGGSCVSDNLWRFNPCGTILSTNICSPTDWYARIFDGPDFSVDPACAIPFQCGGGTGTGGASPGGGGAGTGGGTGGGGTGGGGSGGGGGGGGGGGAVP